MAITEDELKKAKEMLERSAKPLFFYDDDPDGIACFVMAYQFTKEGKGICVKQADVVEMYARKVEEFGADLVVILDKPNVEEEFLEKVKTPILWIDHHAPQKDLASRYSNLTYYNPRIHDDEDNRPTSHWLWEITQENLWLAAVGIVGDWHMPDFIQDVKSEYPSLLPEQWSRVEDLYLDSKLGLLIKILHFNLKGRTADVYSFAKTLTRIEHPDEILKQTTSRGKWIWRRYKRLTQDYDGHLAAALEAAKEPGEILLYVYDHAGQTFTSELSNELLIRYPKRVTIVCRKHGGEYKCSVRSKEIPLPDKLQEALKNLRGRGGGHTNACGFSVVEDDWDEFYSRFQKLISS